MIMNISFLELLNTLSRSLVAGLQNWGNLHIWIVHFPIALLYTTPLFIILGLIFQKTARTFFICALILMILGTGTLFLAVSTGNTASESVQPNPLSVATLNAHIQFGEQARIIYGILSFLWIGYTWTYPLLTRKIVPRWHYIFIIFFLLFYAYGLLVLFNAAHHGGALVHQHHIHSHLHQQMDQENRLRR